MREFLVSVFLAALASLVVASSPARAAEVIDGIAAVVNGEIITLGDLDKELEERMAEAQVPEGYSMAEVRDRGRRMLLESMINDILVRQEAERLGLDVSRVDIENTIRKIREERGLTVEEFRNQLALRNMTREKYADTIRNQLRKQRLIGYMVHQRVAVSDRELAEHIQRSNMSSSGMDDYGLEEMQLAMGFGDTAPLDAAPQAGQPGAKVSLSIIIVGSQQAAEKLRAEVASGQRDFAAAAKEFSQGPGSDEGGSLGEMSLSELGAPIRQAASNTAPGEVSEVFELAEQYAFVKLHSGPESGQAALESESEPAKTEPHDASVSQETESSPDAVLSRYSKSEIEQLRERLRQQKLEARFSQYMQQLRDKAVIRINL